MWTLLGGWDQVALRNLPSHWHRMSARERRADLCLDRRAPPAPEIGADGGYIVDEAFVDALRSMVHP